ncbi:hypothetical protein Hdeb2414_s0014g00431041 [Helianthus debilis subsp. tardiflorus]
MAPKASQSRFSLKVMVHKEEKRVIFAEAGSNFVDTLFSIMTLPMATIVRLLRKCPDEKLKPIGSLNNIYQSLLDLSMNSMSAEENKWMLLNPRTSSYDICRKLKLNINDQEPKLFICKDIDCSRRSGARFSICNLAKCDFCCMMMDREIKYEDSTLEDNCDGGVFVSDLVSYIVTDDLRVMPNSPGSIIKLICELGITAASCLDEMAFDIGFDQILTLVKGALLFKCPLTYMVFPSSPVIQTLVNPRHETSFKPFKSKSSKRLKLKVTMQKSTSKFLFAEADCDFVEFLSGFLEIPLGHMIGQLMNGVSSFESLNNLFQSISNMSVGENINSHTLKDMLLQPQLVHRNLSVNQIFPLSVLRDTTNYCHSYLRLGTFSAYMTRFAKREGLEKEMFCCCNFKDSRVGGRYLKTSAKFILTDDIVITPLTSFSSITLLGKLKVPFDDFEEVKVSIGIDEGLEIFDAALKSVSALTDSILKKIKETEN